ncbi:MAG: fused DSP-PTPase phosphatase/NAD kinase-like protein [Thermoanaerobaculia bacterium]
MGIENFGLVDRGDGWALYRGAQPDAQGFARLRKLGVTLLYKLNTETEASAAKAARFFGSGKVIRDPVRTLVPDADHTSRAVGAIQALTASGETVFVHCSHGQDRTGMVIAGWRILVNGWTVRKADEERRRFGGGMARDDVLASLAELAGAPLIRADRK